MASTFKQTAGLHQHYRKQERLVFDASIVADSTPADKVHSTDLPGLVYLRTEGKTAAADAVEDLSAEFTTAADENGIFGIVIDLALDPADKIYPTIQVVPSAGTIAVADYGISPNGRIFIDLNSNQNLGSDDLTVTVAIDYTDTQART